MAEEELDWLEEKYIVVMDYDVDDVIKEVNQHLSQGYKPYGELYYADGSLYQVMMRK